MVPFRRRGRVRNRNNKRMKTMTASAPRIPPMITLLIVGVLTVVADDDDEALHGNW